MKLPIKRYIRLLFNYLKPLRFRTMLLAVVLLCGIFSYRAEQGRSGRFPTILALRSEG